MSNKPKFAHVVFQTGQPNVVRDWYCAVLDGHVVYQDEALCFITFDDEHHRVALLTPPTPLEPRNPAAAGAHHVAYTFDHLDDLLDRYQALRDRGIHPAVCIAHGVTTSMYYRDPDGNFVEMQIDNFAEPEQATEYMRGPEYAADSVGPAFDPEAMLAARRDGADVGELTTRSWSLRAKLPSPMPVLIGAAN
ncbi:putative extradiol ring-cleavage dioxygenase [Nocardia nova SH22a]|uniref:Putative extradiol ring-cleavage dioxygenase n=1 Tax=Nocardia nova SH22a TaxID=1415166 RepID=W5TK91_9NOCA|nr:VOC family protein [Nocardia nova]AHH19785.1 putative extradiol ring-cleavage dioxygenase [Nocardia nova SH22a]